ncbi:UMP kinase [Coralliovum pocilloporae]|uniref:UMP kinase n=1 Tax=Coralliovum pocilloporae TaxID=3066369 RepID=UPI003306CD79
MSDLKFKRVLLKLSGEALMGDQAFGIDRAIVDKFAAEIGTLVDAGAELALVIGGGNIFRGVSVAAKGGNRVVGDHMGMLATVMNGLAMGEALSARGIETVVMSAIAMPEICETFTQRAALDHMNAGRVVIFVAGTGNPYFTTDSGAALRAAEMQCDALLKATQVDGIYSADPKTNPDAERFDRITHSEVIERGLAVMDTAAFAVTRENAIPIIVFSLHDETSMLDVLRGAGRYTLVSAKAE